MEQESKQQINKINEDKKILKKYLSQYYSSRMKKQQLERRLKNIRAEMNTPIGGHGYRPVNYGGTNKVSEGAAAFTYRIGEIETRIEEQKECVEEALLKVMDIIDLLNEDSMERMILELRFIDCKSWAAIGKEMHLSRSSLFFYQDKGLKELLKFKRIEKILIKY